MGQLPIQTTRAPKARRHVGASIITALLAGSLLWAGAGVASAVTVPADGAYFGAYVQSQGSQTPMDAVTYGAGTVGLRRAPAGDTECRTDLMEEGGQGESQ